MSHFYQPLIKIFMILNIWRSEFSKIDKISYIYI